MHKLSILISCLLAGTTSSVIAQTIRLVRELAPGSSSAFVSARVDHNGRIAFSATISGNGGAYTSDGTAAGTLRIPGLISRASTGFRYYSSGNTLFFYVGNPPFAQLWASDLSAAGTRPAPLPTCTTQSPELIGALNGSMFLAASLPSNRNCGRDLFSSDGTAAGTTVLDLYGDSSMDPNGGGSFGRELLFEESNVDSLWTTDGTAAGTRRLLDWSRQANSSIEAPVRYGRKAVVLQALGGIGRAAWVYDGTSATSLTMLVGMSDVTGFLPLGDRFIFSALDARPTSQNIGRELYRWTSANGVELLKDIHPGAAASRPRGFTVFQDQVYFAADDGSTGLELWRTDGTVAGTVQVTDLESGPNSSDPSALTPIGSRHLVFRARTAATGREFFVTDGTASGTRLITDLEPGTGNNQGPGERIVQANGVLYTGTGNRATGTELYQIDVGATATTIPGGCSSALHPPVLTGTDPVMGSPVTLRGEIAPGPMSAGVIMVGVPSRPGVEYAPGCRFLLDLTLPIVSLPVVTQADSSWSIRFTVPNTATLDGKRLAAQAAFRDPASPFGSALSNGVLLRVATR